MTSSIQATNEGGLKARLIDQTFPSNVVLVTQNVRRLNVQKMYDQTSDKVKIEWL